MAGNSIGQLFKLSTFGESHGPALGGGRWLPTWVGA